MFAVAANATARLFLRSERLFQRIQRRVISCCAWQLIQQMGLVLRLLLTPARPRTTGTEQSGPQSGSAAAGWLAAPASAARVFAASGGWSRGMCL